MSIFLALRLTVQGLTGYSNWSFGSERGKSMGYQRHGLLIGLVATVLLVWMDSEAFAASRGDSCRRGDRISIVDLDMSPDPIAEGQRVRSWRVRLRLDSRNECDTTVEIRETGGNDVVAREREYRLRPGMNEIDMQPSERYRFEGKERCYTVIVDVEGGRRSADADRRFCARNRATWSLREPTEWGREGYRGGPPYGR
jgi:hypothetical protein